MDTFRDAYCEYCHVSPEKYAKAIIRRCLYPSARLFWPLLEIAGLLPIGLAYQLIEAVGETRSKEELIDVIEDYEGNLRPYAGFLVNRCKMRICVAGLVRLHNLVRAQQLQTSPGCA